MSLGEPLPFSPGLSLQAGVSSGRKHSEGSSTWRGDSFAEAQVASQGFVSSCSAAREGSQQVTA
eukprot:4502137-Alexandrium_andersonii.AAC.1